MMACNTCGSVFSEEDAIKETEYTGVHSEGFSEAVERYYCPNCGDEYVEEANRCQFCGGWTLDYLCPECAVTIRACINNLLRTSHTLHKLNGVKFNRVNALNAITDVMEDM